MSIGSQNYKPLGDFTKRLEGKNMGWQAIFRFQALHASPILLEVPFSTVQFRKEVLFFQPGHALLPAEGPMGNPHWNAYVTWSSEGMKESSPFSNPTPMRQMDIFVG